MFHSPASRARRLELLHDRRLVVGVAGVPQLALVDLLGGIDVLVHERGEALLELRAALAWLEVHRVSFVGGGSRCISSPARRVQHGGSQGHRLPGMTDGPGAASYRAAGVDYDALDAAKRMAIDQGAVHLPAARGRRRPRARLLPRGAGVRVRARRAGVRVRGGGAGHEVDRGAPGARRPGDQPLRRRGLRHGRRDRQRPLLRRRAAARGQRLLRDRGLGVVPAAERAGGAAGGLAQGLRGRGLRVGRRGVAVAARACSTSGTSSWRAPRWAWCPRAARPILGAELSAGR